MRSSLSILSLLPLFTRGMAPSGIDAKASQKSAGVQVMSSPTTLLAPVSVMIRKVLPT